MTLEELKKKIAKKKSIPAEYRNFEEWDIIQYDWDRGICFMSVGEEGSRGDSVIEIAFIRDDGFITENCWDFYLIRNSVIQGFGSDELKFFATILDTLMNCEDDYPGKN